MSDDSPNCAICGEPVDDHENPDACPVESEDETPSAAEIRDEATEDVANADAAALVTIEFPDDEDGEVDYGTASFAMVEDMSEAEIIAAKKVLDDGLDKLQDTFDESPEVRAMAAPPGALGQLLGGGAGESMTDGEGSPGVGFQ